MSNRYAMIWTTDRGYFPGTNATLNALELYGNEVDVVVLTWGDFLPGEYMAQWKNVSFIEIDRKAHPGRSAGWHFRFADIEFALKYLSGEYPAVLFWSADQCVVNNIMDFFVMCEKTSRVILGTNEHSSCSRQFANLSKVQPYSHTWSVPYTDQPVFVPANNTVFLQTLMDYQARPDNRLSRMDGINYAVRDSGTKIFETPGELWIQNVPYKIRLKKVGNHLYFNESSTRLYAFHRRYWNTTVCRNYLPGNDEKERSVSRSNKMLFNRMYHFLNTGCRVPWTEGLEVWDGS